VIVVGIAIEELSRRALEELQIRISGARLIVHIQVSRDAVEELVGLVRRMKMSSASSGSEEDEPGLSILTKPTSLRT
jgi:hypothetical protein